jgi:hypothetical protein
MSTPVFRPLVLLAFLSVSVVYAAGLAQDQRGLMKQFGGTPVLACEAKVQPIVKRLLFPQLVAIRPDSHTMVYCSAYTGVGVTQLLGAWKTELQKLGYVSGQWTLSDGTYSLQSTSGKIGLNGHFAISQSLYHPFDSVSGLMTVMGVESARMK